ncbi:DUF928 domain-containing protein [Calothrix sp. PCC 6303]|uniref:DUF928 domain-containing protein n=1 Tax=Calothrix sp. PCC 6303 TaxID=1170562 RepID=UPI0002A02F5B|nr:DUF928 domain-containing protein [Calothrix sp. PCC 6303]AFZ02873.1 protein of unknown function DUF928 [Calothrix sp. PCC 6303]
MSQIKNSLKPQITIFFALFLWIICWIPSIAQSNQASPKQSEPDGSSRGRPSTRKGTGSRGDCPPVNIPLTALIPENNQALTLSEHPNVWVFVPYTSADIVAGEFVLQDEKDNDIYRTNFTPPDQPGIVSIDLKKSLSLQTNTTYQWYFKLYCSQQKLSNPIFVKGLIKRTTTNPEIEKKLKIAKTPQQRFSIYYQNNIWYEAVSELAKSYPHQPQNRSLFHDWFSLLKSVDLENLTSQPVIGDIKKVF